MQIGLVGGIEPAAQDYYTRALIAHFAALDLPLDLTTVHADAPMLLANLAADRRAEQADLFADLTQRLARAGAGCVAVTSIGGHFCRREFAQVSALPIIDMIEAVAAEIGRCGFKRLGVLGTRTVMETRFYGDIATAQVIPPAEPELSAVHAAYAAMASAGTITPEQQGVFDAAAQRLIGEQTVEAVMLGGTDLALAFDAQTSRYPLLDCAAIHVQAIVDYALAHDGCSGPKKMTS